MAGAGTGSMPCSVLTVPLPTLIARGVDFADVEQIQRHAGAYDIGDGIHRAYFVEVNFFDGHAVDAGFGVAQAPKHIRCILFRAIR